MIPWLADKQPCWLHFVVAAATEWLLHVVVITLGTAAVQCHYHHFLCFAMTPLQPDNHAGCTLLLQLPPVGCHYCRCVTKTFFVFYHDSVPPDNHAVCILLLQLLPVYCYLSLSLLLLAMLLRSSGMHHVNTKWVHQHYRLLRRSFHKWHGTGYMIPGMYHWYTTGCTKGSIRKCLYCSFVPAANEQFHVIKSHDSMKYVQLQSISFPYTFP